MFARAETRPLVSRRTGTNISDEVSEADETTIRNPLRRLCSVRTVTGHGPYLILFNNFMRISGYL
jgi:hypothetical protein